MGQLAGVSRTLNSVLVPATMAAAAVLLGTLVVRDPRVAIAVPVSWILGLLVLDGRISWLVPVTIVALAWGTSTLPLVSLAFSVKFGMLAITALTAVVWLGRRRTETIAHLPVPSGAAAGYLGLLLFALLSSAWSVDGAASAQKALSMFLLLAACFVAVPLGLRSGIEVKELVFRMSLVPAGVGAAGLILGLTGVVAAFDPSGRFQGILNSPNALGYLSAPLLPPLVMLAASEPAGRRRRLMLLAVTVLVVTIALSGSRAGSLATFSGVVVGLFASGAAGQTRVVRRALLVATMAIGAAALAFPSLGVDVRSETTVEGLFELGTGSERSVVWGEAIPLIAERPLAGHGFGTTPTIFPAAQGRSSPLILGRTHNSYLEAAVDLGWTGMLWLMAIALGGLVAAWRVSRLPGPDRVAGTALLAGVVGGVVEGMFESGLLAAGGLLAFPFWTVVALAHSLRVKQKNQGRRDTATDRYEPLTSR
jgi:O-antigen ligase